MKCFATKLISCIWLLVVYSQSSSAQTSKIDSVLTALEFQTGLDRLRSLSVLAEHFSVRDSAKALDYGREALDLAHSTEDPQEIGKAWMEMGAIYQDNFKYEDAQVFFSKADSVFRKIDFQLGLGSVQKSLGNTMTAQGYYQKGITNYKQALNHFLAAKDTSAVLGAYYSIGHGQHELRNYDSAIFYYYKIIPHCAVATEKVCIDMFNELGTVYSEINEPDKALNYLKMSLDASFSNEDSISAGNAYMNIAGTYFFQQKMDSCEYFLNQSIDLYNEMGHTQGQLYGLNNLALIYKETGQLAKSIDPTNETIQLAKKINDRRTLAGSYLNMADINLTMNQLRTSQTYSDSAFQLMTQLNSKFHLRQYYDFMTRLRKAQNNMKGAFDMRELHYVYKDSMVNEQKNKQIAELETKYETQKKEQQIVLLSKEKALQASIISQNELELERNQAYMIVLVSLLGVLILVGFYLYKRQKFNQQIRLEEERNALKADQIKAVLHSQEEERKRFAMDLHDDFGQLISALRINVNKELINTDSSDKAKSNALLDDMYKSLKNIAFNLMPQTLVEKGLSAAAEELCLQLDALGTIKFNLRLFSVDEKHLSDAYKVALYRVIQEVLNNIIKYANATEVEINITGFDNDLNIVIEDNGDGFDSNKLKMGNGNGWRNISSRLDLMHGEIDYDTTPGRKHSTVSITVPYINTEKAAA